MRRAFTIQLYDLPVHAHICPECDECIPCRLPCCSIVRIGPDLEYDFGYGRVCIHCMELARLDDDDDDDDDDDVADVVIDWCEHCGGGLVRVQPKHYASSPHHAWCSVGNRAGWACHADSIGSCEIGAPWQCRRDHCLCGYRAR